MKQPPPSRVQSVPVVAGGADPGIDVLGIQYTGVNAPGYNRFGCSAGRAEFGLP